MSEKLASIPTQASSPDELKPFQGLRIDETPDGEVTFTGVKRNWHTAELSAEEILEAYGKDPDDKQPPAEGIWKTKEHDNPVKVVGSAGRIKGEEYLQIEGSDTAVPRSEIEWVKPAESQVSELTNAELTNRVLELQERMRGMEEQLQTITRQNQELTEQNRELAQRNEMLESLLRANGIAVPGEAEEASEAEPAEQEDTPRETFSLGGGVKPNAAAPAPEEKAAPAATSEAPETLGTTGTVAAEEVEEPAVSKRGNAWHRISGRIGRIILGGQASLHNRLFTLTDRQGRREAVFEEVIDEERVGGYTEQERRAGAIAVIGGAALVGAGVLVGWLLWGRHGGHDVINNYYNNGTGVVGPSIPGGSGGANNFSHAGQHLETYNLLHGTGIVQVELPQQFDLVTNSSGVASLVDLDTGKTILSGDALPRGMFRSNGQLSVAAVEKIQDMGWDVSSMAKKIVTVRGVTADHLVSVVS